jgi:two-component system phosphate regulon response regulator PhoB
LPTINLSQMDRKILIIEDNAEILDVLKTVLEKHKYEVIGKEKTEDIIEDIIKYQPELILTDYLLNGLNGGKICQMVKSNPTFSQIPVILITAHQSFAELHGNFGFDALISKPFEISELLTIIKKHI